MKFEEQMKWKMNLVFALVCYKMCFGLCTLKNYLKLTEFLFLTFHPHPSPPPLGKKLFFVSWTVLYWLTESSICQSFSISLHINLMCVRVGVVRMVGGSPVWQCIQQWKCEGLELIAACKGSLLCLQQPSVRVRGLWGWQCRNFSQHLTLLLIRQWSS